MTEHDHVDNFQARARATLPYVFLWKIADRMTGGLPDLEIDWNGFTTKIEFKLLKPTETVHDKWEDERQPITCAQLEHATGRCWIVAWKKGKRGDMPETLIYRPSKLLRGQLPVATFQYSSITPEGMTRLWNEGVLSLRGIDHDAVVELIRQTHR